MKKLTTRSTLAALVLAASAIFSAQARTVVGALPVDDARLTRNGQLMTVTIDMNLNQVDLHGDKALLFTPYIVNGSDSLSLPPVGLYSRNRWYQYERKGEFLGGPTATSFRYSKRPDALEYVQHVDFQPWMNGAHVALKAQEYECCNTLIAQQTSPLQARYREFTPSYLYQTVPDIVGIVDEVKTRELSGRAFVDFPVNEIVIYPTYRNNTVELGKIIATIDSVRNDEDVTVNSIFIKGTASPEGPYNNNIRLAKGRTEALCDYVRVLYNFPEGFIKTDYEPVDWEGLREYLETHTIENGAEILAIVNSNLEPFARNQKIKTTYPKQYEFLHKNVYPSLRHSDYRIEYTIRQYTTVEEIATVLHSRPDRLTLNEMLFLAQSYEPGSDEFNDVFEMAVRMFPDSPVANLNVATSAMERGDLVTAARYLPRAGNSPEALYARANLAFLQGDYAQAGQLYREAAQSLPQAQQAYQEFLEAGYGN